MKIKRIVTILGLSLVSVGLATTTTTSVKASTGDDIVAEAMKMVGKYTYGTRVKSSAPRSYIKKYSLKKATVPKRFRGTYYSYKSGKLEKIIIRKNSFKGGTFTTKGNKYITVYKLNSKVKKIVDNYESKSPLKKQRIACVYIKKNLMNVIPTEGQPNGFHLSKRHGHKVILHGTGVLDTYYTSKSLAKKYVNDKPASYPKD